MWILVGAFKSLLYLFTFLLWLIVISSGTNFPIFDSLWKVRSTWSFFNENFTPWTNVCIVCSLLLLKEFCTEVHALDMHYTVKCDMLAIFANCALVILYGKSVNFAQNHKNRESQLGPRLFFFSCFTIFAIFRKGTCLFSRSRCLRKITIFTAACKPGHKCNRQAICRLKQSCKGTM